MSYHDTINKGINETNFNPASPYFPPTPYNGCSIVDGLKAINAAYNFDYRAKIAERNGMESYLGKPEQNIYMLNLLKNGRLLRP